MTELEHLAERAKTATEAEARARVTMDELRSLGARYNEAVRAYGRLCSPNGIDIEADMAHFNAKEEAVAALTAYQAALKKYQEQGK